MVKPLVVGRSPENYNDMVGSSFPGQKEFYSNRDEAYKETVYGSSSFTLKNIAKVSSVDLNSENIKTNVWSGMYGTFQDKQESELLGHIGIVKKSSPFESMDTTWISNPNEITQTCTGNGIWYGNKDPTIFNLMENRFRDYKGTRPMPSVTQRELENNKELQHMTSVIGPRFDASEHAVKIIHPCIPAGDMLKIELPEFIVNSFVGWHFSNEKSLGRTVFAMACGQFYENIKTFFDTPDPSYNNEERGINLLGNKYPNECEFIRLIKINIPKRSKVELIVHPILPAIVHVRGNTTTSLTTPCVVEVCVKSSTYRW